MFNISLSDATYCQKSGSPLKTLPLKAMLHVCYTHLIDDKQKGKHGQIFPYINNVLGKEYWPSRKIYNDHVAFFDLDWLEKNCAEAIFNSFERLCELFPSILAIQYSSSYFFEEKPKNGLHIYVHTYELDNNQFYNECRLIYMVLLQVIYKVTGYDLSQPQLFDYEHNELATIVDCHNMEMTQRVFLYYSPYKWNDNSEPFDAESISQSLDKLEEKWGWLFQKKQNYIQYIENNEDYSGYVSGDSTKRIKVDRNLNVAGMSGNDLRWRISSIANNLFGDKAKEWCDKHFWYEDNKSIWTKVNKGVNHRVLTWLTDNNFIEDVHSQTTNLCEEGEGLEVKTYLGEEYKDLILEHIEKNKVFTIQGDPGLGKTNCLGQIAKEINAIVLTPYLVMRRLYETNGLEIVDERNLDTFDYEKPFVCVYDKLVRVKDKIQGRTIILDESHILFNERLLRNTLIEVMSILNNWDGKLVIVSATPLMETSILGSEETLKFWKKRKKIKGMLKVVNSVNDMKALGYSIIMRNITESKYDYICLFGNRAPRMAYDNCSFYFGEFAHNNINIFHRDYEKIGDIDRVTKTEILDKKINIGTSLVYNGLNFKNESCSALVIVEYEECETHWSAIVQAVSRLRKCDVTLYVIASKAKESEVSLDERIDNAKKLEFIGIDKKLIGYDRNLVENEDVVREIFKFKKEECTIDKMKEAIKANRWIELEDADELPKMAQQKNVLARAIGNIIKKELHNKKLTDREIRLKKDGKEYYDNTIKRMEDFVNNFGISFNDIITLNDSEMVDTKDEKHKKTVSLGTTMTHIEANVLMCVDDDKYWNEKFKQLENAFEGTYVQKDRMSMIKKVKHTRKLYRKWFEDLECANNNGFGNVKSMIDEMMQANIKKNEEKQAKRAVCGKNSSPKKSCVITEKIVESRVDLLKKYGLYVGMEFDSLENLSNYCKVTQQVVSQWVKKGWLLKT